MVFRRYRQYQLINYDWLIMMTSFWSVRGVVRKKEKLISSLSRRLANTNTTNHRERNNDIIVNRKYRIGSLFEKMGLTEWLTTPPFLMTNMSLHSRIGALRDIWWILWDVGAGAMAKEEANRIANGAWCTVRWHNDSSVVVGCIQCSLLIVVVHVFIWLLLIRCWLLLRLRDFCFRLCLVKLLMLFCLYDFVATLCHTNISKNKYRKKPKTQKNQKKTRKNKTKTQTKLIKIKTKNTKKTKTKQKI